LHASEIMNGKHSLVENFSALTIFLDDEGNSDEIDTHRRLKKIRIQPSHVKKRKSVP
jgi:hypothetical protein